jgi:hypothetical protein
MNDNEEIYIHDQEKAVNKDKTQFLGQIVSS